jgi:uncharacterized membrane protein YhaH (DUF805 family)
MRALRFLFSPIGRLPPQTFIPAAIAVYALGAASEGLTVPAVLTHAGLWPFALAQTLLIWLWFVLHAKRLRDAGRPIGLAAGGSLLYALAVVLLMIVAVAFVNTGAAVTDANATNAGGLLLLASIIATLLGSPHYDLAWFMVTMLTTIALVPVLIALGCTVWAATRPREQKFV